MTEPQRYMAGEYGPWAGLEVVTYADAKAWVEREVAAARREGVLEGRRSEWVHQEDEMRDAYEQGQRDERARIGAYLRDETQHPSIEAGMWAYGFAEVIDATAPQDGES